jgi:ERCC4-type nuclease
MTLKALGTVSLVPEDYGSDFLWASPVFGLVGVQRKEASDFVASVMDGRLDKELAQMKQLGLSLLILEGRTSWTNDGLATWTRSQWRVSQHLGKLWSIQLNGCWVVTTTTVAETSTSISAFMRWTSKPRHIGGHARPGPEPDEWGKVGNREWAIHLLQGFKGIGPKQAAAIFDHFDGVPMSWDCDTLDLLEVPGIGEKRADQLMEALRGEQFVEYEFTGEDSGS